MRLGIDLGTTRTLVALADRGNYPLIGFATGSGDISDHYPTSAADLGGQLVFGHEAEAAALEGAPVLRSWKRLLTEKRPADVIRVGHVELTLFDLATRFLRALRRDLLVNSNLPPTSRPITTSEMPLEVAVSVPANAHSAQRFITLEAFRAAGFNVRAILNEPSAAGIEYAHRHRETITARRERVAIYDFGGGTFDAALVSMSEERHDVVATHGIARLGGDDFDAALLELAMRRAGLGALVEELDDRTRAALLLEAQRAKESISPTTKRVLLELAAAGTHAPTHPVIVEVAAFYEHVAALVESTMDALEHVLVDGGEPGASSPESAESALAGLYVVGGASALPLVPRRLRERFGRKVHRSPHPAGSVAMGLAIVAAGDVAPTLQEVLTRHLGVFRESAGGSEISFDGILPKGSALPPEGEKLSVVRRYRAAHNLGHFRFVECGELDPHGGPTGDITPHGQVLFPFAPALRGDDLQRVKVERLSSLGPLVEERYQVDSAGVVEVTIANLDAGYEQRYVL